MENELDSMMGFDRLGLYYAVHMAGIDGECFLYSVYFDGKITDEIFEKAKKAVHETIDVKSDQDYLGYVNVSKEDGRVQVFLDLGSTDPERQNDAIYGVLKALDKVSGIKNVIINEDAGFEF